MKYKIGDIEVEALLYTIGSSVDIAQYLKDRYRDLITIKMGGFEFELGDKTHLKYRQDIFENAFTIHFSGRIVQVNYRDFIVITDDSILSINADYFEKIAIKAEPPRFKIGDVAFYKMYSAKSECNYRKINITKVHNNFFDNYAYDYNNDGYKGYVYEYNLFTLEEAIEKLKEL